MSVWQLVERAAHDHPDRVLLRDEHGRSLTALQLRHAAEEVAAGLGVQPTDVVSWQLPTSLEAAVLLLALARVGAVQNPILPILGESDVRQITAQIGTSRFVTCERWRSVRHGEIARRIARDQGFDVLSLDLDPDGLIGSAGPLRLPTGNRADLGSPPRDAEGCRWIYFTSGTTALAKGVRHSDASLLASSSGMVDGLGIAHGDSYPIAWPITHIGGITMLSSVLRAGGTLVLFESFDPATIGERMAAFRPTILGTGIPFFRAYLEAQQRHGKAPLFPALRAFVAGGAPTPPEIVLELTEIFGPVPLVNSYGLTEFPIASSPSPADPSAKLVTSVGRPALGVEVRTRAGELQLRGPQRFLGYVDAELDRAALDEEGWFRTGDLGSLDAEGFLSITGRLKDVIIRNGENISALEVESVLLGHPAIVDVAVIGVPNPRTGERVCAVCVLASGATIDLASVAAHCQQRGLARHKTPEQIEVVDSIERNPMGKVVKADLLASLVATGLRVPK